MGKFEDLEKLQKLKETGVLTEEEFNQQKQNVLNAKNITHKKIGLTKIFYIISGIMLVLSIIVGFLKNYYLDKYLNLPLSDWKKETYTFKKYRDKSDLTQNLSVICLVITDIIFFITSIISFIKSKKDKKDIIRLIVEIIVIIVFTIGYIFFAQLY